MSVCVEERKRRKEDNNRQMALNAKKKKKSVNLIKDYMWFLVFCLQSLSKLEIK